MTDRDLELAGSAAVMEALRLWDWNIFDPKRNDHSDGANQSRAAISYMIKACGWSWAVPYQGDKDAEWCGFFVGACWKVAGLDAKWLATYFASTYRLDMWGRYYSFNTKNPNPKPETGPYRLIANLDRGSTRVPFPPRAGDILTIGDGNPEAGDHICLVESYDEATHVFQTIEGNGTGLGPDGKQRQGVVRGTRHVGGEGYCARRLIRPAPHDLVAVG